MSTNTSISATSEALLGRYVDGNGAAIDGGPRLAQPLPALSAQTAAEPAGTVPARQLESGIKVLDLYAPLLRGGIMALVAGAGVGKTVLMEELIQRIATRQGGCAVLASLDDDGFNKNDVIAELRSSGVERYVAAVLGRRDEPPGTAERVGLLGLTLAEDLCRHGREVLLFLDELVVTPRSVDRLLLRRHGAAALTTFVLQHKTPADRQPAGALGTLLRDADGRIVFNRALGQQNIWPAVDPVQSSSRLLSERLLSAEHARVAGEARELLRRTGVVAGAGDPNDPQYARARRMLLFQGQPFVVAEPYTAMPGEYVPLTDTIRAFGELLAGKHDALPEEAIRFVGTIEQAVAKAGR